MKIAYYHFPSIDSTNNFAKNNLSLFGRDELTVIYASQQTAGRGRFQRNWVSLPGNLFLSLVAFTSLTPFFVTQMASIAVDDVLQAFGVNSRIKWPNDLVVHTKKIGGILTEKTEDALIIGIGLNISMTLTELADVTQPATSLYIETNQLVPVQSVFDAIVQRFHALLQNPSHDFQKTWLQRTEWMIHQQYTLKQAGFKNSTPIEGTVTSIAPDGTLMFTHTDGTQTCVQSGEIV